MHYTFVFTNISLWSIDSLAGKPILGSQSVLHFSSTISFSRVFHPKSNESLILFFLLLLFIFLSFFLQDTFDCRFRLSNFFEVTTTILLRFWPQWKSDLILPYDDSFTLRGTKSPKIISTSTSSISSKAIG